MTTPAEELPATTPAGELWAAAQRLLDLADATDEEIETNAYWHSDIKPRERWYANGVENAIGIGPSADLAGLLNPDAARRLAAVFRAWARMAGLDPDLLHRIGGEETVSLARQINGTES